MITNWLISNKMIKNNVYLKRLFKIKPEKAEDCRYDLKNENKMKFNKKVVLQQKCRKNERKIQNMKNETQK
ncbi:MAG: hypothetical protein J6A08_00545 [Lachnospiraceae bacterium]|nr:hypothetical protein [Lachnospiraceae bacterium]